VTVPPFRVVIVTGASRGLGCEIALAFGRAGDRVLVNYLSNPEKAQDIVDQIAHAGSEALAFKADVRSGRDVDAMIAAAVRQWGRIDVLVNNAGTAMDGLLLRMPEQDWDTVLETNLSGPFHAMRSVSPVMTQQGCGHVINIASIVGVEGREGQANYAAAKSGLIGLTKAAARELGRSNIQVNAVLPGYLATDLGGTVSEDMLERIRSRHVLNRLSERGEVAEFIHHLSGMRNVSGQIFNLDSRIL
jgi:3-oxoacyl-[acyl-carrier protein] reductase